MSTHGALGGGPAWWKTESRTHQKGRWQVQWTANSTSPQHKCRKHHIHKTGSLGLDCKPGLTCRLDLEPERGCESCVYYCLTMWPWSNFSTSPRPTFLLCEVHWKHLCLLWEQLHHWIHCEVHTYRQREGTEGFSEVEGGQVTLGLKEDEWHPTHVYAGWEVKKCGNKATVAVQARSSKGLNQQGGGRSTMKEATKGLTEDE